MITIADRAFRAAEFRSSSLDEAARTIEIVFSTGAAVKRYSWDEGFYMEELDMSSSSVDLGRLNAGASFLDSHAQETMANRLGAVLPGWARLENGQGVATVLLSTSKSGEQILADLRAGLPLPVSVGYRIHEYEKTEAADGGLPVYRATKWEPMEISAVTVPADAGAMARAQTAEANRQSIPVIRRAEGAADPLENSKMTIELDGLERTRVEKIMELAERYNAPMRLARKAVSDGKSEPEFREMILAHRAKEDDKTRIFSIAPSDDYTIETPLAERLADAISARLNRAHKPADGSRPYVGLSVSELARRALEVRGTSGMSPNELVKRALNTTSDFPTALLFAGQRELAKAYTAAPSGLKAIAKATTSRDFRPKATIILQGGGQLLKVNEHAEFRRSTFVEGVEQYALSTFGRVFGITRHALVNDDLGVFADLPARFGRMASEFEAGFLTALLEGSPKMGDGKAVFHVDHANLAAVGGALSITTLSAGRLAMRQQVDSNGDLVMIAPRFLIVPASLETVAEQLLATITASSSVEVNPFAGKLELIVEPRLKSPAAWYLAADPAQFTSMEFAHLEGEDGPRLDQRVGFDVDGTEYKVALDFGAAITDHRGLYKNPGA